jgi:hypothetical protein
LHHFLCDCYSKRIGASQSFLFDSRLSGKRLFALPKLFLQVIFQRGLADLLQFVADALVGLVELDDTRQVDGRSDEIEIMLYSQYHESLS